MWHTRNGLGLSFEAMLGNYPWNAFGQENVYEEDNKTANDCVQERKIKKEEKE